jgi:hypothetical protein
MLADSAFNMFVYVCDGITERDDVERMTLILKVNTC